MTDEGRSTWQDVIDLGLRIRGINQTASGSASSAGKSSKPKDHDAAIRRLYAKGYHPAEIRDAMMAAGYFKGKTKQQVLPFIYNLVRQARKPAQSESLKVDTLFALAGRAKGK